MHRNASFPAKNTFTPLCSLCTEQRSPLTKILTPCSLCFCQIWCRTKTDRDERYRLSNNSQVKLSKTLLSGPRSPPGERRSYSSCIYDQDLSTASPWLAVHFPGGINTAAAAAAAATAKVGRQDVGISVYAPSNSASLVVHRSKQVLTGLKNTPSTFLVH